MKKILLLSVVAFTLLAAGCNEHLANDQIISQTKKCVDAGLEAHPLTTGTGLIQDIQCYPKK